MYNEKKADFIFLKVSLKVEHGKKKGWIQKYLGPNMGIKNCFQFFRKCYLARVLLCVNEIGRVTTQYFASKLLNGLSEGCSLVLLFLKV